MRAVLVPADPGTVSAFGLLTVDVKNDYVRTAVRAAADLDVAGTGKIYAQLEAEAADALTREGFPGAQHRFVRSADLRYVGQAFEVRVPVPDGRFDQAAATTVAAAFHDAHRALYGYDFRAEPSQPVEWVNLRVTGIGPIRRPQLRPRPRAAGAPDRAGTGRRPVYFDDWTDTASYARERLAPGDAVAGPAIIEEYGSTVPVHPGFTARVDDYGNLVVTDARETIHGTRP